MIKKFCALCLAAMILCSAALASEGSGSWQHINQDLQRPDGWRQIVENSAFTLGNQTELGTVGGITTHSTAFGEYPSIDGSTVAVPMAIEFGRQHLGLSDDDLNGFVFFSTTHQAYVNLIEKLPGGSTMIASRYAAMDASHPVDMIIATEPSDEELALAEANGIELIVKPVCYDAFVFITHKDNPINGLTVEQIRDIYVGRSISWKAFGGKDERIYAYQREANSGSQTAMEKLVMQGRPMDGAEPTWVTNGMGDLVARVGAYENRANSLGYTYLYYIDTLYKSSDIKVLAVNGVLPTAENIRSGAYPFTTNYYGVIRAEDEASVGGRFLTWMLSDEGQRSIEQAGYIPMTEVR